MKSVIPVDPALPQLGVVLSESAMADVFAATLRDRGTVVDACRIERIKYRPRRNCMVSYRLSLRAAEGRAVEQSVAARVCSGGESARRADKASLCSWQPSAAGPAFVRLAALDALTSWWPNDAKLETPRLLTDENLMHERVLPEVVHALTAGQGTLTSHRVDIVQYVPEHRLCARVRLRWRTRGDGAAEQERIVYAKANREASGADVHAVMRAVEASSAWSAGRLRTPRSLLWQPAHGLHWQQGLPGEALLDAEPQVSPAFAAAVGLQLAALHRVSAPIERILSRADVAHRPAEVAAVLGEVDATWKPALARLTKALAHGSTAREYSAVTLHGDLHPRNVLLEGQHLSIIDLDSVRRGPALLDLGAWIADALYRALLQGAAPARATASWQAFVAGYAAGGGEQFDEPQLAWAAAYQLLCQRAWRCVVNLKPGRFALAPQLIALTEAILRARSPHVSPRAGNECSACTAEAA